MNWFLAHKVISYYMCSRHERGHGIHSPFVYSLIRNVFLSTKKKPENAIIEKRRKQLLQDSQVISVLDLGAGSQTIRSNERVVKNIAASSLSPQKYASLLQRIIAHCNCKNVLEMGTSLGVSASYMATTNPQAKIITLEGAPEIAKIAEETFAYCGLQNQITCIQGNFSDTLSNALNELQTIDFAFVDGNHQEQATIEYFQKILPYCHENTVLVFDDICWSPGMWNAWQTIIANPQVSISINLCKIGLVFFRGGILKQDFTVRF